MNQIQERIDHIEKMQMEREPQHELVPFMEFWKILLYAGRDIRYGEAVDLYKQYEAGFKTKNHRIA